MSGIDGIEGLDELAAFLRELGPKVMADGCKAAAEAVGQVAAAQWAQGESPDGKKWVPRKADGAVALRRPLTAVKWVGRRGAIVASYEDVIAHHRGKRPAFPFGSRLPPAWRDAADAALRRVAEKEAPK